MHFIKFISCNKEKDTLIDKLEAIKYEDSEVEELNEVTIKVIGFLYTHDFDEEEINILFQGWMKNTSSATGNKKWVVKIIKLLMELYYRC